MRIILWLVAAFALIYAGYWYVGSRALRAGMTETLARLEAQGLADHDEFTLGGFPSRFDMRLTGIRARNPEGTFEWQTPELRIQALSYKPHHVIVTFPPAQTLRLWHETFDVTTTGLAASAAFGIETALPLAHAEAAGGAVTLQSSAGWGVKADEIRAAVKRASAENAQDIGIELTGITVTGAPARIITTGGMLPDRGERFYLDATLGLDRPIDRFLPGAALHITSAEVRSLALDWGPAGLTGEGTLAIRADGRPEGELALGIRNWQALLKLSVALGIVRPDAERTLERALGALSLLGGRKDVLTLPLIFRDGQMSLGPVPLGPAPRL